MAPSSKTVFDAALALPVDERVELAERLFASLDATHREKADALWVEECDARIAAYDKGEIKATPGDEVFRRLRAKRTR